MSDYRITHEFMDWEYIQDTSKTPKDGLQVIPAEKREIPESLYKFYSLTSYNLDALQNRYLYASHPYELNDKFDCFEGLINFDNVDERFVKWYFQIYHKNSTSEEEYVEFKRNFKAFLPISLYSGFGVVSLTGNLQNPLMWAHYASSNHGFALKFKLECFSDKILGPFPINYQSAWKPLSLKVPLLTFLYLTNVKSQIWKHEDEWRMIGVGENMSTPCYMESEEFVNNRKFPYPKEAIEEVVLGNMFTDRMEKHFDEKYGTVILALTPNVAYVEQKAQVLEFIWSSGIKASYIYPDVENKTFALKKIGIKLEKIDEYTYLMHEDQ